MSKHDELKIPASVTYRCGALAEAHGGVHTCGKPTVGLAHGQFPACAEHGGK